MPLTAEQLERVRYLADDVWADESKTEDESWVDFDCTLAEMSAEELHAFVEQMNWDGGGANRLKRVLAHPLCDRGTALMAYWRGQPTFFLPYQTRERVRDELEPDALEEFDLLRDIERRFANEDFASAICAFDPTNDGGHNWTGKRTRVKPTEIWGEENGRRVQLNRKEPWGDFIEPRAILPANLFKAILPPPPSRG